jgi:hypothetical protein
VTTAVLAAARGPSIFFMFLDREERRKCWRRGCQGRGVELVGRHWRRWRLQIANWNRGRRRARSFEVIQLPRKTEEKGSAYLSGGESIATWSAFCCCDEFSNRLQGTKKAVTVAMALARSRQRVRTLAFFVCWVKNETWGHSRIEPT